MSGPPSANEVHTPVPLVLAAPTLAAAAVVHGAYRWTERRLYEVTGAWAAAPEVDPEVRVHLFEMSGRHAWHAGLWAERLPVLADVDGEALTRPFGTAVAPVLDALATAGRAGSGGGRQLAWLAGLYRVVLPRLVVTYRTHLARLAGTAPEPTSRALRLVLRDEEEQQWEGESLLQGLVAEPEDHQVVAAAQSALELLAVGHGARRGLVPWWEAETEDGGLRSARPT